MKVGVCHPMRDDLFDRLPSEPQELDSTTHLDIEIENHDTLE